MNKNKLISILMPVKNTSAYLVECIESIVKQTETNWELIVVNDHSGDDSYSILKHFADKDSRIKVHNNIGNGIIDALRLAYKNSKGSLITRMDSDDIMALNKLAVLKANLLDHGMGHIALGCVKYFSHKSLGEGFKRYESWLNKLIASGTNFDAIYKECVIPSPNWMVFKKDLDKSSGFLPNEYPEDYDLAFRFYRQALIPIPCAKVLHYWRDYPMRTSRTHEHYADQTFLDIKFRYFLKLDYDNTKKIVIWGAGTKGKKLVKKFIEKKIQFYWICDNPKKIGKHIYHQEILPFTFLEKITNPQSIITVANPLAQQKIVKYLKNKNLKPKKDFVFFC